MNKKLLIIKLLSLSDLGLVLITYLKLQNFNDYKYIVENYLQIDSPFTQFEIYKLLLQTTIFVLLCLFVFHLFVYYFFYKNKKIAQKYVLYYSLLAAVSLLLSFIFTPSIGLVVPTGLYFWAFYLTYKIKTAE